MRGFYLDMDGDLWFGPVPRLKEDIKDSLILGKGAFRLLYPEARSRDKMFDSLKMIGDTLYPDIDGVDTHLFYEAFWSNYQSKWCVKWNRE